MSDNPPAFPEVPGDFNAYEGRTGMTLRDWFAGQVLACALAHAISHPDDPRRRDFLPEEWAARIAYGTADAMLAERSKIT